MPDKIAFDWSWASDRTPAAKAVDKAITRTAPGRAKVVSGLGTAVGHGVLRPLEFVGRKTVGATALGAGKAAVGVGKRMVGMAGRAPIPAAIGVASLGLLGAGTAGAKAQSPASAGAARAMHGQARNMIKVQHVMNPTILQAGDPLMTSMRRELTKQASARGLGRRVMRAAGGSAPTPAPKPRTPQNQLRFSLFGGREDVVDYRQYLLAGLALAGAATAAGMGGQAAAAGAGKVGEMTHRLGRERHYKAMIKASPELKQYPERELRQAFNVMHRASPFVSKEPLIAASTVRSLVDSPRVDRGSKTPNVSLDAVRKILDVESARQGTRYPMFQETRDARPANLRGTGDFLG